MSDWLQWLTRPENSGTVALVIFFVTFCAILIYVYTGRKRSRRLESYKYIPLNDEQAAGRDGNDEHD
jgi:cbb3-type cytochrome oxidase subunit 3